MFLTIFMIYTHMNVLLYSHKFMKYTHFIRKGRHCIRITPNYPNYIHIYYPYVNTDDAPLVFQRNVISSFSRCNTI